LIDFFPLTLRHSGIHPKLVMNNQRIFVLASFLVLALAVMSVRAASIGLRPVADTTLQSAYPTSNFGGGTTMTAGGRRFGGQTRALILFDIADSLPAGAIINSVSFDVTVVRSPIGVMPSTFDLNRLTASWGEGTGQDQGGSLAGANAATWNNRFGTSGSPWISPGGDFSPTASSSTLITGVGTFVFSSTPSLVADVQSWLDHPANNFGWIMLSESELTPVTIERFGSHEDKATAPSLQIQYSVVPEPASGALIALGVCLLPWWRRSAASPLAVTRVNL
jgi:hypothetical protein